MFHTEEPNIRVTALICHQKQCKLEVIFKVLKDLKNKQTKTVNLDFKIQ